MAFGYLSVFFLFISIISGAFSHQCRYQNSHEFSLHEEEISKGNYVGRVSIGESFVLSFDLLVNSMHGNEWVSVLHIGNENGERSPGIWLSPSQLTLHVCLSDTNNWNTYNNIEDAVEIGKEVNFKLVVSKDGTVTGYLNHVEQFSYSDTVHLTRYTSPIWIGDPWYTAVDGTVKNLKIESYDDECSSSMRPGIEQDEEQEENEYYVDNNGHHKHKSSKWQFNWWEIIMINIAVLLVGVIVLRSFGFIKFSTFGKNVDAQYQALVTV